MTVQEVICDNLRYTENLASDMFVDYEHFKIEVGTLSNRRVYYLRIKVES